MRKYHRPYQGRIIGLCALGLALGLISEISRAVAEPSGHNGNENMQEKKAVTPGFVTLPLLSIPLIRNNRVAGSLSVEIVLDAITGEAVTAATENQSLLIARYNEALGKWAASFQDVKAPANVIAIKQQLQKVTDNLLGNTDTKVLLQSAMLRRKG